MPKYHQHISRPIRGPNILDHCYTTIKNAYCSIPCPHFGKSNHNAVFLLPAYEQKLKQKNPSQKEAQCWSEAVEDCLQDCLDLVDWTVFKCSVENLDEYATTVTDFVRKCVEDCVPKKSVQVFPNRKCSMNKEIHSLLKTRSAAFKSAEHSDPVWTKEVFSDIFNLSLLQTKVPTCFKKTTIIPLPKKTHA
eukprot:g22531.t1